MTFVRLGGLKGGAIVPIAPPLVSASASGMSVRSYRIDFKCS